MRGMTMPATLRRSLLLRGRFEIPGIRNLSPYDAYDCAEVRSLQISPVGLGGEP